MLLFRGALPTFLLNYSRDSTAVCRNGAFNFEADCRTARKVRLSLLLAQSDVKMHQEATDMPMKGTLINVIAVLGGTSLGIMLKKRIPERVSDVAFQGIGIFTIFLGIKLALETQNVIMTLFSLIIGGTIGAGIDIEGRLESAASRLEMRFATEKSRIAEGFLTATLLFCIGPMAILGSLEDGISGNYHILMTKSIMDGFSSIAFGAAMGIGVALSAVAVFIYQGTLTLLASFVSQVLTDAAIVEMTATGGLLIVGIGINMLGIKKIRVANLLPAIAVAPFLIRLFHWL